MKAIDLIQNDVPPIKFDETIEKALSWMDEFKVSHLPVLKNGNYVGLVSETDILDKLDFTRSLDDLFQHLPRPYVKSDAHLFEILSKISEFKISVMPILDHEEKYLGCTNIFELMTTIANTASIKDKGGILNTNLNASNYLINGNKDHITNIIINLMDNAIKYCDKKPNIKIETYNQKNDLIFTVSDNGIGMTPNVQKKIFDKFYRATSGNIHNIKGHGLGLSYVKKIVDLHKGKIILESKFGVGTNFIITLPLELK